MASQTWGPSRAGVALSVCGAVCAAFTFATTARAQVVRQDGGVFFAGQAIADPRGSLSMSTNPAGLGELRAAEGRVQFSAGGEPVGGMRGTGWGLFGSLPAGPFSLGLSLERTSDRPDAAQRDPGLLEMSRLSLGTGLRLGDELHLGLATRLHATDDAGWTQSWDAGLLLRVWSWLSLGVRVTGMGNTGDGPTGDTVRTRYGWGWALRPFAGSDRLTWAMDVEWPAGDTLGAITTSLSSRIVDGVTLRLEQRTFRHNQSTRLYPQEDSRFSLALEVGLGHFGADLALRGDKSAVSGQEGGGVQVGGRISSDVPHSLFAPGAPAVVVTLKGQLSEQATPGRSHFARALLDLHAIAEDPAISLVVVRAENLTATWPQIEELRRAIAKVRKAGKRVAFYADGMGNRTLALAAACEKIAMPATGSLMARGVGARFVGLKDTLAHIGVAVEAVRFGDHKSAPESFTRKQLSEDLRATLTDLVQQRWDGFVDAVSLGRGVTVTRVAAALDRGAVFPEDARAEGLIDAVVEPRDLDKKLVTWGMLEQGQRLRPYKPKRHRRKVWGSQPRIAIVTIEGAIVDGDGGDGVGGQQVGGGRIAGLVRSLERRSDVKGLVARIDSGGGAVRGSDLMYQALRRFDEKKPAIASMGGVAASGGYWTALGGRRILADASTITGSIGIFTLKPDLGGLYSKLDLGMTALGKGPHWEIQTEQRPWTPAERALMHRTLGRYYDLFLQRTTLHRQIPRPRLMTLAEGRIFTGDVARKNGLVDQIGGLWEAIELARREAGLQDDDDVRLEYWPQPDMRTRLMRMAGLRGQIAQEPSARLLQALTRAAGPWIDQAVLVSVLGTGTPLAITPVRLSEPMP